METKNKIFIISAILIAVVVLGYLFIKPIYEKQYNIYWDNIYVIAEQTKENVDAFYELKELHWQDDFDRTLSRFCLFLYDEDNIGKDLKEFNKRLMSIRGKLIAARLTGTIEEEVANLKGQAKELTELWMGACERYNERYRRIAQKEAEEDQKRQIKAAKKILRDLLD
jgi:hypothetical protein